ncbi:tryptophan synthase subunit alpha [Aeromicrobium wangtongii]|uniref:Tryptophan synthase alpha chain n=1 Tax=Aeromicrobium wangtongii TaxID=2969247 RepID=A0ABY5MCZ2_9ACTN|nr:tryptophan synthase subunit alpha [Aeromicrobium wangtongii]MCD9197594.1 tryptophan synthase subunit alpha [Aeromicrobium wangtongii]UUP15084.1 tryptophan synthase subunit alpha [Aeromicrobium wangtongii]
MSSSIDALFERTRAEGRAALVGYLPAGFPSKELSIKAIEAMVEGGVDMVEVGLPYSDPVMDGPVIQAAAEAALVAGTRPSDVLDVVRASAATGAPTVVMTYWNPVERYGVDRFAADLAAAGGAGLITPDLIPDEGAEWVAASQAHDLDRIFLVAPSSTDDRLAMTVDAASGFVYATAVMGVTGARDQTSSLGEELVARVRKVTDKPVGVGLGVSNGAQAHEIAAYADAVIVGSALVRCLLTATDESAGLAAIRALAQDLRAGVERS